LSLLAFEAHRLTNVHCEDPINVVDDRQGRSVDIPEYVGWGGNSPRGAPDIKSSDQVRLLELGLEYVNPQAKVVALLELIL
jgi:hypothetical protein